MKELIKTILGTMGGLFWAFAVSMTVAMLFNIEILLWLNMTTLYAASIMMWYLKSLVKKNEVIN